MRAVGAEIAAKVRTPAIGYPFAVGVLAIAVAVQLALWPHVPPSPHLLLYPAVFVVVRFAGLGPALLAIALSLPPVLYWFLPPYESFAVERPDDLLDLAIYAALATALAVLVERARKAELRARLAVRAAPVPMLVLGADDRIVYANPAAERTLGAGAQELRGRALRGLVHADDAPAFASALAELDGRGPRELTARVVTADGRVLDCEWTVSPVERAVRARYLAQFLDVTPRKRAEAELEQLRSQWNAVIAHDLRQPINAILLRAQLLAREETVAATPTRRAIDAIARDTRRLNAMVLDILDVSRLEARRLPLARRDVNLAAVLEERIAECRQGTPDRTFEVVIRDDDLHAWADPDRLAQIFDNLLSNAVKYGSASSSIRVEAGTEGARAYVSVSNDGAGIAREDLPHVFERFRRSEALQSVGLGLYIVRELVLAHGGDISCTSEPGRTTTFRLTIPLEKQLADQHAPN